jgi:hypothetical protein
MSFDPEQITFFAETDARGQRVPFGIKAKDRTRHVYVIGKTGMGKSTLLENMAIQDIKNGNGLAFIDPHGQTAETLLDYIPEERKDDVLYFAPFDTSNPVSFNVMEDVGPERRHLVVSGLMSVFKKIWVDAWSARMEYILSNTLMALLEYPDSTLLGVNRMLSDKNYRKKVVDNIKDPSVRSFWVDEFAKYNERYMQEAGDAIKNKIGQFTSNPLIRNIVGQPKSSFDIRKMMDERKILIMNLSKGLVGESNANLLGSMLTTRIYLAAMSRADMGPAQMQSAPNFYFYVDEFQSFANATFANILSEARKYKLNLTIAHQYIEQMEEEVRNAVFGNVGTIISFRVGPFDAEVLETIFTPKFLAPDIVNLGFAQIYLTLMIDGIGSQPFSATTLPPIKPAVISYKDVIIHRSREQFAHPREAVEKAIYDWHGTHDDTEKKDRPERKEPNQSTFTPRVKEVGSTPSPQHQNEQPRPKREERSDQKERRQGQQTQQHKNQNNQKKDGQTHRGQQVAPPVQSKSIDELRAVLRNISSKEGTPDAQGPKDQKGRTPVPTPVSATQADTPSLKDMLAKVVKEVSPEIPSTLTPKKEVVRPPAQTPVPETRPTEVEKPVTPGSPSSDPDTLSPKKLERMMRVTTSDKTPLG